MKRRGWLAATGLVILSNLIALSGVGLNRVGEPDASLELTERELPIGYRTDEDSGVWLRLSWSGGDTDPFTHGTQLDWLDPGKLEELGFDCSLPLSAGTAELHYDKQLPREAYAVLEQEGGAWEAWLAERQKELDEAVAKVERGEESEDWLATRREELERRERSASRLFAVDAGVDPAALRRRYPDRGHYAIVPAVFELRADATEISGVISRVLVDRIHVSRGQVGSLDGMGPASDGGETEGPRYTVSLRFGRRHEPWIESLDPRAPEPGSPD
jgi:hypothetical protein